MPSADLNGTPRGGYTSNKRAYVPPIGYSCAITSSTATSEKVVVELFSRVRRRFRSLFK